jgi:adenine-specific DNA-methyltransferase
VIKYIGSKRVLMPWITQTIQNIRPDGTVIDLFSGTSRVGHALKAAGYRVLANDHNAYAATLARCLVQADADLGERAQALIDEANGLPGTPGYFTRVFCEESRYFQPKNGARVDAIRDWLATKQLDVELEAVMLVSLMLAADRVDSTTGVQMAYLKQWAARAHRDLRLTLPLLLPQSASGKGQATELEAIDAASLLTGHIAYLDPPYNQHKYLGNYHIWETLVRWDHPEAYGIARKRIDCKTRRSDFNSRPRFREALRQVVTALDVDTLVISFSDEGYISRSEMTELLSKRGPVRVIERPHKRYVGAQIGIHNPAGKKVGKVSHLKNTEYLFVVG